MTDTFPAFSSVARSYAAAVGFAESDYVAGMWKAHLPGDLMWARHDPNMLVAPNLASHLELLDMKPYVSPSWSWAHHGKVSWEFLDDKPDLLESEYNSLETRVIHGGKDALGAITHAELSITGTVVVMPAGYMVATAAREHVTVTTYMKVPQPRMWASRVGPHPGDHRLEFMLDWEAEGDTQDVSGLKMLVLGSFPTISAQRGLAGLLIHGVGGGLDVGQNGRRYNRVGVFRSVIGDQVPFSVQKFLQSGVTERVVLL